jgi:hypothetical protein
MSPRDADALCGTAGRPSGGGCERRTCQKEEVLDDATGVCLPRGSIRSIAESMQITTLEDETLVCTKATDVLVAAGNNAACVDKNAACGVGARVTGSVCAPERACAPGEVATPRGTCTRVVFPGPIVDVATWAELVLGPDGGYGSSFLCGSLSVQPWVFTTVTDTHLTVTLDIDLAFPDNDLTQTQVRVQGRDAASGQPIVGLEAAENAMRPLISSLRALGGTARAAGLSTHVRCVLPLGPRPIAAPSTGGSAR